MKPALSLMADALLVIAVVIAIVGALDLMVFGMDRPGLFA